MNAHNRGDGCGKPHEARNTARRPHTKEVLKMDIDMLKFLYGVTRWKANEGKAKGNHKAAHFTYGEADAYTLAPTKSNNIRVLRLFGRTEESDVQQQIVEANVHETAPGEGEIEYVQQFALTEQVVAFGVLAVWRSRGECGPTSTGFPAADGNWSDRWLPPSQKAAPSAPPQTYLPTWRPVPQNGNRPRRFAPGPAPVGTATSCA